MNISQPSTWMGLRARTWGVCSIILLTALVFTSLSARAYIVKTKLLHAQGNRLEQALAFSLWRYGIVEAVDITNRSLIVSTREQFPTETFERKVLVYTDSNTRIGEQNLVGEHSTYTMLSPIKVASLSDIKPGMRVALVLDNRIEEKRIVADIILFGNPL